MMDRIAEWAEELQSLAQAGRFYGHDDFDKERYQHIRDISLEMMSARTDISPENLTGLLCQEQVRMCFDAYKSDNCKVQFG